MKHYFTLIFVLSFVLLKAQSFSFTYTVYFDTDKDQLSAEAKDSLAQVLDDLEFAISYQFKIQAFTDNEGSSDYNYALAQRRAQAVLNHLKALKLDTRNAVLNNFGETKPQYDNVLPENRQKNRRVDIYVDAHFPHLLHNTLQQLNEVVPHTYTISTVKSTCLLTERGTFLMIPAHAFVTQQGKIPSSDKISLKLEEYYELGDMLLAGLSTVSHGKPLITGGMINIKAFAGEEELQLAPNKEIALGMPLRNSYFDPGMELFWGSVDPHGSTTNWIPAQSKAVSLINTADKDLPSANNPLVFYREAAVLKLGPKPLPPVYKLRTIPLRPQREDVNIHLTFFQKMFTSKQKIEAKKDKVYNIKLEFYKRQLKTLKRDTVYWKKYFQDSLDYTQRYQEALASDLYNYQKAMEEAKFAASNVEQDQKKMQEVYEKGVSSDGQLSQQTLDRYFFAINRLGWINCDKFMNTPENKQVQIAIQDNDNTEERLMLVFPDLPSILAVVEKSSKGDYVSPLIPKGSKVKLIGIKVDQGRSMLAIKDITVGESKTSYELVYLAKPLKEIQKVLHSIN